MEGGDVMRRWMREGSLRRYGGAGHPKKRSSRSRSKTGNGGVVDAATTMAEGTELWPFQVSLEEEEDAVNAR